MHFSPGCCNIVHSYCVSAIKARNLVTAGCMTIADMHKPEYLDTLTTTQKVGLRFVDQIPEPVTREQAETVLVSSERILTYAVLSQEKFQDFIRDHIDTKFESQLSGS